MFLIQDLILVVNSYVNKSREGLNEYVPILESDRETRLESTYIFFLFLLLICISVWFCFFDVIYCTCCGFFSNLLQKYIFVVVLMFKVFARKYSKTKQ